MNNIHCDKTFCCCSVRWFVESYVGPSGGDGAPGTEAWWYLFVGRYRVQGALPFWYPTYTTTHKQAYTYTHTPQQQQQCDALVACESAFSRRQRRERLTAAATLLLSLLLLGVGLPTCNVLPVHIACLLACCRPLLQNSLRENITDKVTSGYFGFSVALCMSCSMSAEGGAGLGTVGFSVPVARKLIVEDGGFSSLKVLLEDNGSRWFVVR